MEIMRDNLLTARYLNKDETFEEFCNRIADFIISPVDDPIMDKQVLVDRLINGEIIFNSPLLMNAGKPQPLTSACYVLPVSDSLVDSTSSIMDLQKLSAKIFKLGAGVGVDYSLLRPEGTPVGSGGTASGPVSFMHLIDTLAEVVKSGGKRRAAIMSTLKVNHPDIKKFITSKLNNKSLSNTNISVMMTDEFMNIMLNNVEVSPEVKAQVQDIWDLLVESAWSTGDPGLVFIDVINKTTNGVSGMEYTGVNACVTGDTLVYTNMGYKPIKELVDKQVEVWNGEEFSLVTPKITRENAEVIKVKFSNEREITCTPDHTFYVIEKYRKIVKKKAIELAIGDSLLKVDFPIIDFNDTTTLNMSAEEAYANGFFSGDGYQVDKNAMIYIYSSKKMPCLKRMALTKVVNGARRVFGVIQNAQPKFWVPHNESISTRISWLAGLIDADGCINTRNKTGQNISITSTNLKFLEEVDLMLNTLGVTSSIRLMCPERKTSLPDGKGSKKEYECNAVYRLLISQHALVTLQKLGLTMERVKLNMSEQLPQENKKYIKVASIEHVGIVDKVYCFNETKKHMGVFNGLLTGQCSEFSLYPYESCLIGTINLAKFCIKDKESKQIVVDYEKLREVVKDLVIYLDTIIDKAWYPDDKIKKQAQKYRRIGIGITGLGDLLIKMKLRYDSHMAQTVAQDIMKFITTTAVDMSEVLVKTGKAPFPEFSQFRAGKFYEITKRQVKPRRNLAVTVIAPTGSTSIICGAECSGIEPIYAVAYKRMMRLDTDGDTWFDVVSPLFVEAMLEHNFTEEQINKFIPKIIANGGSVQDIEGIPDTIKSIFKTAHEIAPIDHLNMVASIQPYVENAISKTINLPATATKEDVADLYIKAWTQECKGITIFRDGCKSEQVYSTSAPVVTHPKEERPDVLSGQTMRMSLPQGSLYVNVTYKDNAPFELFAILGKSGLDHHAYCEALGRMISLCLRSGINPSIVSKALKGIRGRDWGLWGDEYIWSVPHALGVALEYSLNTTPNKSITTPITQCPECGGKMVIDNGCLKCLACEYSKCSA